MATSDAPLNVPNVTLAVARGAAPALSDGDSLTLTGSGFEAVANPLPSGIDTFSEYTGVSSGDTVPTDSASGAKWDSSPFESGMMFDDQITLGSRAFSAKAKGVKSYLVDLRKNPEGPERSDEAYFSHHLRFNEIPNLIGDMPNGNLSFKFARYWYGNPEEGRLSVLFRNGFPTTAVPPSSVAAGFINTNSRYFNSSGFDEANRWVRFELETVDITDNGDGTSTHTVNILIDGKFIFTSSDTVSGAPGLKWRHHLLGSDPNGTTPEVISQSFRVWLAEVYDQPSRSRVELSNNPTYDTSVKQRRFYQVCSERTGTLITIPKVFLGDLDTSQPIYAHVIKSDGSAINLRAG